MMILFHLVLFGFCILVESKNRTASLIVLPPLILGYDELLSEDETSKSKDDNRNKNDDNEDRNSEQNQDEISVTNFSFNGDEDKKLQGNDENKDNNLKHPNKDSIRNKNGEVLSFVGKFELPKKFLISEQK